MKRKICLLLVILLIVGFVGCGEKVNLEKIFIGQWRIESYESSEGVFTNESENWEVKGHIVFYEKSMIYIDCEVERENENDSNVIHFSDFVYEYAVWEAKDEKTVEVKKDDKVFAQMKLENDKLTLVSPKGNFVFVKVSDSPYGEVKSS